MSAFSLTPKACYIAPTFIWEAEFIIIWNISKIGKYSSHSGSEMRLHARVAFRGEWEKLSIAQLCYALDLFFLTCSGVPQSHKSLVITLPNHNSVFLHPKLKQALYYSPVYFWKDSESCLFCFWFLFTFTLQ